MKFDAFGDPIELTEEMIDGGPRLHIGWGYGDDWTNEGYGTIAWHGNGYTADNNIQACITCHNAGSHKSIAAVQPDPPYSVDMMYLMHKAHSDAEILYPQDIPGRCHACHAGSNEPHPNWLDDEGFIVDINVNVGEESNCDLCHGGTDLSGRPGPPIPKPSR